MIKSPEGVSPMKPAWRPIQRYDLALERDATWSEAGAGVEQRDLGLGRASDGAMQARRLRTTKGEASLPAALPDAGHHFHLLYVLGGTTTIENPDGTHTVLGAGDCIHQPGLASKQRIKLCSGTDLMELTVSAQPLLQGKPIELEPDDRAARPVIERDLPDTYVQGDGPRSYFLYRDLGVAAATGRRIHIHVLKATAPSAMGGTGEHRHSMCQLFYVFNGWADLEVEGTPSVRMHGGDAMCISAGTKHNVPAFSSDYAIIEICIPADYDTVSATA